MINALKIFLIFILATLFIVSIVLLVRELVFATFTRFGIDPISSYLVLILLSAVGLLLLGKSITELLRR